VAPCRAAVKATAQSSVAGSLAGPLGRIATPGGLTGFAATVATPRASNRGAPWARPRVAELGAVVRAATILLTHVTAAVCQKVRVLIRFWGLAAEASVPWHGSDPVIAAAWTSPGKFGATRVT